MELPAAVRKRRMVRAFTSEAVDSASIDRLLDLARRAPSAGNTQPVRFLVLEGPAQVGAYWDVTLPAGPGRERFRWPGLLAAPALVIPYVRPDAYAERYAEADKAATGLGSGTGAWSVPYWWVDGGAAVQTLLLAAVDAGLGACFFGQFGHESAVRAAFDVPDGWRALGTVALGRSADRHEPGRSAERPRPPLDEVVRRGAW